jgi:hypothetical protein
LGEGAEWFHLAQVWDRWKVLVNAVMNLRVLAPQSKFSQLFVFLIGISLENNSRDKHLPLSIANVAIILNGKIPHYINFTGNK